MLLEAELGALLLASEWWLKRHDLRCVLYSRLVSNSSTVSARKQVCVFGKIRAHAVAALWLSSGELMKWSLLRRFNERRMTCLRQVEDWCENSILLVYLQCDGLGCFLLQNI
jgi:hypothetical protein